MPKNSEPKYGLYHSMLLLGYFVLVTGKDGHVISSHDQGYKVGSSLQERLLMVLLALNPISFPSGCDVPNLKDDVGQA